jgi:hypothetical protein
MDISLQGITHRISISASDAEVHPDDVIPPKLKQLFAYWQRKKGTRIAPSRGELWPEDIVNLLPHIMLIDVVEPERRLRYRLIGTELDHLFGTGMTGQYLDETDFNGLRPLVVADYLNVVDAGEPSWTRWKFITGQGRRLEYERIALPLAFDGARVDMLLVGIVGTGLGPLKWTARPDLVSWERARMKLSER